MEQNPNAVFYGRDLERQFPEDFRQAIAERLIIRIPTNIDGYSGDDGTLRIVLETEDGFEAIDQDDPEAEPVSLNIEDLTRYKLNVEAYTKRVQEINKLTGKAMFISERLFFLGESRSENTAIAYVLAFINDAPIMKSVVASLLTLLPQTYNKIVAVYPKHSPTPTECRKLEDLGILAIGLRPDDCFALPSFNSVIVEPSSAKIAFRLSENSVEWDGKTYPLRKERYAVLKIMLEAHRAGEAYLAWKQIKERLVSFGLYPTRMSEIFKGSPLWKTLILRTNKNLYHLNI
jgi:hypothetical protein